VGIEGNRSFDRDGLDGNGFDVDGLVGDESDGDGLDGDDDELYRVGDAGKQSSDSFCCVGNGEYRGDAGAQAGDVLRAADDGSGDGDVVLSTYV